MRAAPGLSVAAFCSLYVAAAWLYPGGTRADPKRIGFSLLDNYWCDLLDATSFDGRLNPARPVAIAATIILSAGLACLWWSAPALYSGAPRRSLLVRSCGLASGALTPFIATRFHDLVINLAVLLGIIAFISTMTAIGVRGSRSLTLVSALALVLVLADFLSWKTGLCLGALPLVQKGAFAAFLSWVVLLSHCLPRQPGSVAA